MNCWGWDALNLTFIVVPFLSLFLCVQQFKKAPKKQ